MQATAKPPHAGRVVLLQKERTLQRLSHGKVIESHWDGRLHRDNERTER